MSDAMRDSVPPGGPIRTVAAVIRDAEGRVLLVRKRGSDTFIQPGGKREPGEDSLVTLARELREELGVELRPASAHRLGRFEDRAVNEPGRRVQAEVFLVEIDGVPAAQAEIDALCWVDPAAPGDVRIAPLSARHILPRVPALPAAGAPDAARAGAVPRRSAVAAAPEAAPSPARMPWVFWLACALGGLYLALMPLQPWPLSWLLKPAPMLLYAGLLWRACPGATGRWLALGFSAAALGDGFLDYGEREGLFIEALRAFFVTQIAYALAFRRLAQGSPWRARSAVPLLVALVAGVWLVPASGALWLPVLLYLLALLGMALAAGAVEARPGPVWLGAVLFMLADALIAVNRFAWPFDGAIALIVALYFSGQSLIVWGLLRRVHRAG